MHAAHDRFVGGLVPAAPFMQVLDSERREWERVLSHLREWLSPQQLLDTLCAAVAAELSLSCVALLRRGEDGSLSRIASADATASARQDGERSMGDRWPSRSSKLEDAAYWTFPDRGGTDVLVFAGDRPCEGAEQWSRWARRIADIVVRTSRTIGRDDEPSARFAASDRGVVDQQEQDGDTYIRVTLEGLSAMEPLGDAGWQRLLDFSVARLVAIAGGDRVAELDDGDYLIRLPRDPAQAIPLLDAMYRALVSPVPGVGALPALEVRVTYI